MRKRFRLRVAVVGALLASGAASGLTQAQERDPKWEEYIIKAGEYDRKGDPQTAILWFKRAIAIRPGEPAPYDWIARQYRTLGLVEAAAANETRAMEAFKAGKGAYNIKNGEQLGYYSHRAWDYMVLGEYAKAKQDLDEGLRLDAKDPGVLSTKARWLANSGELDKAIATWDEEEETMKHADNTLFFNVPQLAVWERAQARRMKGDFKGAAAEFQKLADDKGTSEAGSRFESLGYSGMAFLFALAEEPKIRNLKKARQALEIAWKSPGWPMNNEAEAILTLLEGDAEKALPLFAQCKGGWMVEVQFYHALAQLRAGSRDRAIEILIRVAEINPGFRKRVEQDPEFVPVRAAVLAALKELGAKSKTEDRLAVKRELDLAPITLAYVEGLGRTRRYGDALASLDRLVKETQSETLKQSASDRIADYRAYAELFARLVKAIKKGALKDVELKQPGSDMSETVVDADADTVELKIKGGGSAKGRWSILPFDHYLQLLARVSQTETDPFTIGLLCLDNDRPAQAEASFAKCLAKGGKAPKARIDAAIAARRGVAVPEGGFVVSGGRLVTPDERDNLEKGLVFFRGQWVTKEDKSHLEKNHEKVDGKWVPLTEAQLEARGFVKYGGDWKTKEEVAHLKGEWVDAWTLETDHYEIRTNKSEACLKALGVALEDAYQAYGNFFGRSPPEGKKMKVFAFAKFDDYAAYCRKLNHAEKLNATGFAPSEPGTLCGYDKFNDASSFTRTILHEGCHLFYALAFPSARPPSWVAEGMATNFEGFTIHDGGRARWTFIARDRSGEAKEAIRRHSLPSIAEFLKADAGDLIATDPKKALTFYAEAWAVFYFMNHTLDGRYSDGFSAFMKATGQGGKPDLKEALGPAFETLEADFEEFVQGM